MDVIIQLLLTSIVFLVPLYLRQYELISAGIFKSALLLLILIAAILPLTFHFSLYLQRAVLYFNFLDRAKSEDLQFPERFNLTNARSFHVRHQNLDLGVWHVLPDSLHGNCYSHKQWDESLSSGHPIFVYVHGNMGTRASEHRLELYKLLTKLDYHVISFDYRSYGDSSYSHPHERALREDSFAIYKWVYERAKNAPVYVWGHSLGTGFATGLAALAAKELKPPAGVVLEAPFNNMPSEIKVHPFGTIFRIFPWYNFLFSGPYKTNDEDFNSSKYILEFPSPILILHAEDDTIIPAKLGIKLYQVGKHKRKPSAGAVQIILYKDYLQYGHKYICRDPNLPSDVRNFVNQSNLQMRQNQL